MKDIKKDLKDKKEKSNETKEQVKSKKVKTYGDPIVQFH